MRVRVLALITAVALSLLGAVPASADGGGNGNGGRGGDNQEAGYLALGDSVPFGTDPNRNPAVASNMVGYPDYVANALDLGVVNAACPGEATGGFLSPKGTDNVCRPYRSAFPLHVSYKTTQMVFAIKYLRRHHDTKLVTLTLGANDFFRFTKDCTAGPTVGTCPLGVGGVLATMQANLNTILSGIRHAGYHGTIVALTYYSLSYLTPADTAGAQALNGPMIAAAASNGALVADGISPFASAAGAPANPPGGAGTTCAAGLTVVDLTTTPSGCDVHPTQRGHRLLAKSILDTIAASCEEHNAESCLDRGND
jgi:lysophospholipase L1-like esterase